MDATVKQELPDDPLPPRALRPAPRPPRPPPLSVIDLISSDSDSGDEAVLPGKRARVSPDTGDPSKRAKTEAADVLPLGFLDPLPHEAPPEPMAVAPLSVSRVGSSSTAVAVASGSRQFWKAGDYERGPDSVGASVSAVGIDHVRVHPKFLHSNATSHKWALGALAELLDNSVDEVSNGATYVNLDMLVNKKDGSKMLLVEDNGGGMDPDKLRQCMSLGYSVKSKLTNMIGQYGNGFKTSTMRLGADVIVFSRSPGKEGSLTQSIGMLSYTFLRNTGKEDIVVPMLDYEKGRVWNKMSRVSSADWDTNLETILQWSPYTSERDLLQQFSSMKDKGTRVVIYNLWEDDQGELELDFDSDEHDIQVRGANRDDKKIEMAKQFPNSRHFLTYRHSLRSYASILYLRLPPNFRIILRGKEIEHHNIVTDMMLKQEVTYRPTSADGFPKDPSIAVVTIGFVKDAKDHIDVQGFNVYHKNRLIKPFWRVWNAAGSDGRGVIGVLEANFIEPAHDKQGFERTTVLSRLETRLIMMQKRYWSDNCHKIGYAPRRKKQPNESDRESSPDSYHPSSRPSKKATASGSKNKTGKASFLPSGSGKVGVSSRDTRTKSGNINDKAKFRPRGIPDSSDESDREAEHTPTVRFENGSSGSKASHVHKSFLKESSHPSISTPLPSVNNGARANHSLGGSQGSEHIATRSQSKESGHPSISTPLPSVNNGARANHSLDGSQGFEHVATRSQSKAEAAVRDGNGSILTDSEMSVAQLKEENKALKERIKKMEESTLQELQLERDRNKSLTDQVEEANKKLAEANKEQEALIDIFSEERSRRDKEEENLRKKLKDASARIQDFIAKGSNGAQ